MFNNSSHRSCLTLATSALTLFTISTTATAGVLYDESVSRDLSDLGSDPTFLGTLMEGSNTLNASFNSDFPDYFTLVIPEGKVLTNIVLNDWLATDPSGSETFEDIAFFAIKEGNTFNFDLATGTPGSRAVGLLGWSHLRTTQLLDTQVGRTLVSSENKILREMALSDINSDFNGIGDLYIAEANSNPYDGVPGLPSEEIQALETRLRTLSETWESGATGFPLLLGSGTYSFWLRQGSETLITVDLDFKTANLRAASTPEPFSIIGLAAVMSLGIKLKKQSSSKS